MIKFISIRQPWAWCIVNGYKDVENRTWKTKYRGRILIHASQKFDMIAHEYLIRNLGLHYVDRLIPENPKDYDTGCIVGETEIIDCVENHQSKWSDGSKFQFLLKNSIKYETPIKYKGQVGICNLNPKIINSASLLFLRKYNY